MKTHRFPFLTATAIAGLLLLAAPAGRAATDDELVTQSESVAQSWVSMIDAGEYENSYAAGGNALHEKTKEEIWLRVLKAFRQPRGDVVSRTEVNHDYKPDGFEGTDGKFMVITYKTNFKNLSDAIEVVVLKWEGGQWRGAGYNLSPKPASPNSVAPVEPPTQVQTGTVPLAH